ncbi:MAG: pectinesterase family protein [Patescibacteria group bacterium]|nr:pectinesterase family protein [Patescibacteria group bacterium]
MFKPKTKKLNILILTAILIVAVLGCAKLVTAGNNGNSYGYAWSESTGWIRLDGTDSSQDYGVTVPSTDGGDLSGYAWGENAAWIHFAGSCTEAGGCPGGGNTYAVDSAQTGCSVGWSCLSGYAWGEGVGWIRFAATGSDYSNASASTYGVYIDANGNWQGYAWGEQVGWIHFGGSCTELDGCPSGVDSYGVTLTEDEDFSSNTLVGVKITATGGDIVIANNNITVTSSSGDGHKGILVSGVGVSATLSENTITVSGSGTTRYGIDARYATVTAIRNTITATDADVYANNNGYVVLSGQNRLSGSGYNFKVGPVSGTIESSNDYYSTVYNDGTFRDLNGVRQYTCASTESEGDAVYLSADNTVSQTDADAISSLGAIGFVVKKPSSTTCLVKNYGKVYSLADDAAANLTPGAVYYLSATAGKITTDPGASKYNQQVGIAKSAQILDISIKEIGATTILASGAADAFLVNQSGTGNIVSFQDDGTNVFAIADGGNVTISNITATSGNSFSMTRDLASASTDSSVISFVQDNAGDDQEVLTVRQDGTGSIASFTGDSITTGTGLALSVDGLTTGTGLDITSTSTAGGASGVSKLLNLARSGTNANASHTAYGLYSAVTNENVTSGTNIGGYFSASGATTANYGLIVAAGDVGIGVADPDTKLEVYNAGTQLKLSYDGFNYSTFAVGPSGNLIINASGGTIDLGDENLTTTGIITGGALVTTYTQTKTVAKAGGDYTTIQAAIDALTCSSASPCLVRVMPGVYAEQITINNKSYINVVSSGGPETTKIVPASGSQAVLVSGSSGHVRVEGFGIEISN